jgi:hypothetical protein
MFSDSTVHGARVTGRRSLLALGLSAPLGVAASRSAVAAARMTTAVSVADYGAVGDGVTDDTAAVRAAVASALSEGRSLTFPPGTYLVDAPIRIADAHDLVIEMHGRLRRRAQSRADSLLRFVNCTNLIAISLRTDGNAAQNGAVQPDGRWYPVHEAKHDVRLDGCHGVWIGYLESVNPAGDGLYVAGGATPSSDVAVDHVVARSDGPTGRNAVSVIAGDHLRFGAVRADNVGCRTGVIVMPGGFQIEPNQGDTVSDVQVESVQVRTAGSTGFGLVSVYGRCIRDVQVGMVRVHKNAGTHPNSCDINIRGVVGATIGTVRHSSDQTNTNQVLAIDESDQVELHVTVPRLGCRPVNLGYSGKVTRLHLSGSLADSTSHLVQIFNLDDSVLDLRLRDAGSAAAYIMKNAAGTSARVRFHGDWRRGSRGALCVSGSGVIDGWVLEDVDMSGWSRDTRVKQSGSCYLHRIRKIQVENLTTATSRPTLDTWCRGDFVQNTAPTELGTAGHRYVVSGWMCTRSGYGSAARWVECRVSTGT